MVASLNDWRFQGYLFQDGTVFFLGWRAMKAFYLSKLGRGMAWFLWFTYHDLFVERIFFRHFHGVVR